MFLLRALLAIALLGAAVAYFAVGGATAFVMMFGPSSGILFLAAFLLFLGGFSLIMAIQVLISSRRSLLVTGCILAAPGLLLLVLRFVYGFRL